MCSSREVADPTRNGKREFGVHSQAEGSRPGERDFSVTTGGDITAASMKVVRGILLVKLGRRESSFLLRGTESSSR